jgi:DNA-directed RNA polymerase specialized sigma24 family protein
MTALLFHATEIASDDRAWLVNYCTRLCGDRTVAEDLAQETLLAAWQSAGQAPEDAPSGRPWMVGIARNIFRRWARRAGWERGRLWCLNCGRRHLEGQLQRAPGVLRLRCPDCGE